MSWVASMLTFGSLFSGIGGFDLGLERAGMVCKWQAEIDPFCQRVLAKHWPGVKRYGDVTKIKWSEVEKVDCVCGGFPCQPTSRGGLRLGEQDERWLWPEYLRAVRGIQPRIVIVENVSGLLDSGLGTVLADLAGIGFDAEWDVLPAASLGAPHVRERVFVVAYSQADRCAQHSPIGEVNRWPKPIRSSWWSSQPRVRRVVNGLPSRMDKNRIMALGNAIVPHQAEYIGRLVVRHATQPSFAADAPSCESRENF